MPTCTPAALDDAAKTFQGLSPGQKQAIDTYLLAVIAGGSTDPNTLALAAKDFQGIPSGMFNRVQAYLLCQIASGGGGGGQDMKVAWTPTNVDLGQEMGFVSDPNFSGNPTLPGITTLTFDQATQRAAFDIEYAAALTSISFPNLATVDPTNTQSGYITITANPSLTSISAPLLTSVGGGLGIAINPVLATIAFPLLASSGVDINISSNTILSAISLPALTTVTRDLNLENNPAMTSISLPLLTTVSGSVSMDGNTLLTTINLASFVPTNNKNFIASNDALNAATVNAILHRHVLNAGYVSGIINLTGGTSSAPTGVGIVDAATLTGRGVTVATN